LCLVGVTGKKVIKEKFKSTENGLSICQEYKLKYKFMTTDMFHLS
jgi:hypothetical protein